MQSSGAGQPLYNYLYWLALGIWVLVEMSGAFRQRRRLRREGAADQDRGSYLLLVGSLFVGVVLAGDPLATRPLCRS